MQYKLCIDLYRLVLNIEVNYDTLQSSLSENVVFPVLLSCILDIILLKSVRRQFIVVLNLCLVRNIYLLFYNAKPTLFNDKALTINVMIMNFLLTNKIHYFNHYDFLKFKYHVSIIVFLYD